jgi:hypothetical protein
LGHYIRESPTAYSLGGVPVTGFIWRLSSGSLIILSRRLADSEDDRVLFPDSTTRPRQREVLIEFLRHLYDCDPCRATMAGSTISPQVALICDYTLRNNCQESPFPV